MAAILDFWFWYHGNSGKLSYLLLLRKLISGLTDCKLKEHVLILNYFKNLGGGDSQINMMGMIVETVEKHP